MNKTPAKAQRSTSALILTALPLERLAVMRFVKKVSEDRLETGTIYVRGTFQSVDIFVAQTGPGNLNAAVESERAMAHFKPDLALFVGIAGGVKDVQLGDVVAATKIYAYESGADRAHFETRPELGMASYPLVQMAYRVQEGEGWKSRIAQHPNQIVAHPKAYIGPVAAGEKVIKSSAGAVATLLRANYSDTLAVEMEGAGFLRAAYTNSIDAIVVRGISDLLDGKSEADQKGSQELAADHAAAFAFELLAGIDAWSTSGVNDVSARGLTHFIAETATVPDPVDFWTRFRNLAPRLYPKGPEQKNVWQDAGGDLSQLDLSDTGQTQWSRALRQLELGGGGDIDANSLIERMLQDFGKNLELQHLRICVRG